MSAEHNRRGGRQQYLVTYSQADTARFPTRESFGEMVEEVFNLGMSVVKVSHWACCRESHEDGGVHYHCAVKLNGVKRLLSVKEKMQAHHNIVVNFSDSHDYQPATINIYYYYYYYHLSAYRYVCKEDDEVAHSENHPNLTDAASPPTKRSIAANRKRSSSAGESSSSSTKKRRVSNADVATFDRR